MGRRPTGEVIARRGKRGTAYQLRFRAHGERHHITVGNSADGWTVERARLELDNVLADVRRGMWKPYEPLSPPKPADDPRFDVFPSRRLAEREHELAENTIADDRWQLSNHLLPFFADHRLTQITVAEVDRYRAKKLRDGTRSPASINKTITRLAQVLEVAVEYDLNTKNPARGKRRRVRERRVERSYLDRAEQISALLEAAGELEEEARSDRKLARRAALSTLVHAGLRVSELIALRWRDVDLAAGRLRIRESKTDAGVRFVDVLSVLRDELAAYKASTRDIDPTAYVFPTNKGGRQNRNNVRNRVLHRAMDRANTKPIAAGSPPLPDDLTLHALRRTCASLRLAIGHDVPVVQRQLGHRDPMTTLRIYANVMDQREGLKALVEGLGWAQKGASESDVQPDSLGDRAPVTSEPRRTAGSA